ncbi:uncharacterized protein [Chanodichthys erythropterus]|uniref:uncharacterized protein isoform X1 n=1 Tax=Chanodichthys erythropterus TaxID=933992 RepID=UPI00351E8911
MLLEDMFMMGLNILPLEPLDRNLNEQDQLGPLQEQKVGQMGAEASTQDACLFVQSCEPDQRESDVSKTAALIGSPGQRGKDHNQSRSNTVKLLSQLTKQDHLNKVQNLATVSRNSTPSLTEGLILTPKATAVPDSVVEGEMPSLVMTSIPDDRPDFNLQKCLSPLESEKGDSDVPSKPSHRQDSETQNFPSWLSESPLILDFPLRSMIDSSCPRPQRDLNACQNRSCLGPANMQELKTSFSHNDLISGSSSNIAQPDVSNASERPKQRKTRKRRRTAQKSKVKGDTKCQNLENEDQLQPRISECDEPHCGNIKPSNSDTYEVSTRITRRVAAGMKRRQEISSPLSNKMPTLNTTSKQYEHVDEHVVLPKPTRTRVVKRRRGRPPKPKTTPVDPLCNNAKKLPTSGQDDCEEEKTKTDNETEHCKKQEPNIQPEKDSTEMEEIDINSNFAQATTNSHLKFADQTKGPSILDQIFHQALPRVGSPACRSSLNIDQQLTSRLRNTSFSLQKFQGGKSEDVTNSKLVMNRSEQINKGICGQKKKAETSMLINGKEDVELSDNQSRSPLSCEDMPDNMKCSVKHGDFSIEENSTRSDTVLQNSDLESEIGTDIQDNTTKIYVLLTSEEDITEDMMTSVEDIDDADHDLSPTKMDCVVATNKMIVMEGVQINFCLNPDSAQAEDLGDEQNSEATVSNECSVEMTSDSENVDTQDIGWVADCMENNEKEDLGRNEEDQIKENMAAEETEVLSAHEFVEENAQLDLNEGCWETNNGLDDDGIVVEEAQYSGEMIDEQILLVEDELSQGHIASSKIADNPSKRACPQEISTDAPSEVSNLCSPNVCSEDVSMVLSVGADSESKEDCHSDEEDIEVDVLGESVEEFPLGLLAARQAVTLPIEDLLDQEDELDTTEEEEVDVTGGETE